MQNISIHSRTYAKSAIAMRGAKAHSTPTPVEKLGFRNSDLAILSVAVSWCVISVGHVMLHS